MSTTLPELPDAGLIYMGLTGNPEHAYSAAQLHTYGLAVWKAAMERAADHCQERSRDWIGRSKSLNWEYRAHGAEECAESLLALPLPEQGGPQERRE